MSCSRKRAHHRCGWQTRMGKFLAPAKVNLTLHVTGQRDDGYHLLDSLVMFADYGDRIYLSLADETSLEVEGRLSDGVPVDESNLMVRAARLMDVPVAMKVKKRLPHAAGLGGGSSDAAAVLTAISLITGKSIPPHAIDLGADVPVCLARSAARMRGIGEKVEPVPGLPAIETVLVNPGRPVPTSEVFKHLKKRDNPPMPDMLPSGLNAVELAQWLGTMRNDLQAPAMAAEPVIAQVFETLSKTPGCLLARMSGSGGTCFGLYSDKETARSAAGRLREQNPGWWVMATTLNA